MWRIHSPNYKNDDKNFFFPKRIFFHGKVCLDTLNAASTTLPKIPPDIQNQSKNFHCTETDFFLTAILSTDGIQFCWTINSFQRRPNFFAQSTEKIYFSREQAKLFLFIVQKFWPIIIKFSKKLFSLKILGTNWMQVSQPSQKCIVKSHIFFHS